MKSKEEDEKQAKQKTPKKSNTLQKVNQSQTGQEMDNTKATRQMAAMSREQRMGAEEPGENVEREEAKEEEYDYFLEHI